MYFGKMVLQGKSNFKSWGERRLLTLMDANIVPKHCCSCGAGNHNPQLDKRHSDQQRLSSLTTAASEATFTPPLFTHIISGWKECEHYRTDLAASTLNTALCRGITDSVGTEAQKVCIIRAKLPSSISEFCIVAQRQKSKSFSSRDTHFAMRATPVSTKARRQLCEKE